jgi:hypothetical protein
MSADIQCLGGRAWLQGRTSNNVRYETLLVPAGKLQFLQDTMKHTLAYQT